METMNAFGSVAPPPPPEPKKKKTGLIIGIVAAVLVCCCVVVIAGVIGYVVANPGLTLQFQGTKFTAESGNWSIYYPKEWVLEDNTRDTADGDATFASSYNAIDEGPSAGPSFFIIYLQGIEELSSEGIDTPEAFLNYYMTEEISTENMQILKPVKPRSISGYPGAVTTFSFVNDYDQVSYTVQFTVVQTPTTWYILMGACTDELWNQNSSTFQSMLDTFEIINP